MLILVSTSEQLCSALKRSKIYLPGSMKGKQLNNLKMPHLHKDKIATMDLLKVTILLNGEVIGFRFTTVTVQAAVQK